MKGALKGLLKGAGAFYAGALGVQGVAVMAIKGLSGAAAWRLALSATNLYVSIRLIQSSDNHSIQPRPSVSLIGNATNRQT